MGNVITVVWFVGAIAGVLDALMHPASDWAYADKNKSSWIVYMVLFGLIAAGIYFVNVRPRFAGAEANPYRK